MKIALYSPHWPTTLASNGISTYVRYQIEALKAYGIEAIVVTPSLPVGFEGSDAVDFAYAPLSLIEKTWNKARASFKGGDYGQHIAAAERIADVVNKLQTCEGIGLFEMEESFGWADIVAKRINVPCVLRMHGPYYRGCSDAPTILEQLRIAREKATVRNARIITSPSAGSMEEIFHDYEIAGAQGVTLPNPYPLAAPSARWSLEAADPNMLLFVGRFDEKKGADVVLAAFSQALLANDELRLIIAGPDVGVLHEGRRLKFQEYSNAVLGDRVAKRVRFLGRTPREQLDDLRRHARACIIASCAETYSYVAVEALALGCPLISTRTFGPPEQFKDGHEIALFDIGDVSALRDHILRVTSDHEFAQQLADGAFAGAAREFSLESVGSSAAAFYRKVIAAHEPAPPAAYSDIQLSQADQNG